MGRGTHKAQFAAQVSALPLVVMLVTPKWCSQCPEHYLSRVDSP